MAPQIRVHTLGDSTLDNLYWMLNGNGDNLERAKKASVEGQLQEQLGEGYTVVSHAYDGFTTSNVLAKGYVGSVLPGHTSMEIKTKKLATYVTQKSSQDNFARIKQNILYNASPLEALREDIDLHPKTKHFVVLSVGGNDFREQIWNPIGLLWSVSKVQRQYLQILEKLREMKTETKADITPILMFQYPLDFKKDVYGIYTILGIVAKSIAALQISTIAGCAAAIVLSLAGKVSRKWAAIGATGAFVTCLLTTRAVPFKVTVDILRGKYAALSYLGALLLKFYKPIFERAKKDKLPILDLPNTFDPHDTSLYISQIEPSKKGGELIAEGLKEIIDDYKTQPKRAAQIYSKNPSDFSYSSTSLVDYKVDLAV